MIDFAISVVMAFSLSLAGFAHAEAPASKPGAQPSAANPAAGPKDEKSAKKAVAAKQKRVTYTCEGGVSLVVTYPPEAQAKTRPVKVAMKDTTYFVRPVAAGDKYENTKIKLVFQAKGNEALFEREGRALAEKCRTRRPGS
jgi:membrane-bound inhibitor of C-type lysozyme